MESKKSSKGVIILLIVIIVVLSILCVLFATETISFKSSKSSINTQLNDNNVINNENNNNEQNLESIDYTKYIGTYLNEGKNSMDDVSNSGGVVLKITTLSKNDISFEIQCISHVARIAAISMKEVRNVNANEGVYSFSWFDDGWGNSGIGIISIVNGEIKVSVTTEKYAENANWSMGKFDYLMHKVN